MKQAYRTPDAPAAGEASLLHDVLQCLSGAQKSIPRRWLFDERGAQLFKAVAALPEYYPARTEAMILDQCAGEIAAQAGAGALLVELGSGPDRDTPLLLAALERPAGWQRFDLCTQRLDQVPLALPSSGRHLVFVPDATMGGFSADDTVALLRGVARRFGDDCLLVLCADATQDPTLLLAAYDDAQGVSAAFDKNLLLRLNHELGADFDVDGFRHAARFDSRQRRVEMHLASRREQSVCVAGRRFDFRHGESIHTESAYKHGLLRLQALASRAGWSQCQLWTDAHARVGVHVFERQRVAL